MGNTNFSIHLPRSSFNRHETAQLVLRAVRSLDIDARVNDRNDISIAPYMIIFYWLACQANLMNHFSQFPRVRLRLQVCVGSCVRSWLNAHLVTAQYPGGRIARVKSTVHLLSLYTSVYF